MRIHVLSDLHTEFAPFCMPQVEADVVIMAGDIGLGNKGAEFLKSLPPEVPIIYVAGNHEYYGSAIPRLTVELREACAGTHVHFLENDAAVIRGVRFLGCTLWTDFRLFGEENLISAAIAARDTVMDFRKIRMSPEYRRFTPKDAGTIHARSRRWLETMLADRTLPTVLVTHHAPLREALAPRFESDLVSAAFASDMEDWMKTHGPQLWVHGHTHRALDTRVCQTRVISNQRGYPDEPAPGFDPQRVVEFP